MFSLIIEIDSQVLIDQIISSPKIVSFLHLSNDHRFLLEAMGCPLVQHTYTEANQVADSLACFGRSRMMLGLEPETLF